MRYRPFARLTLVGALTIASCEQLAVPPPLTPTPTVTLTVRPSLVTATLDEVFTLVASVSVPAGVTDSSVTWRSENTAVATVTPDGIVSCISEGTTKIIATSRADPTVSGQALINCKLKRAFEISRTSLAFDHTIGTSPCPQAVGSIEVTAGSRAVEVMVVPRNEALNVSPGSLRLAPGGRGTIAVTFNCKTQTSFTAEVTFFTESAEAETLTVTASIHP